MRREILFKGKCIDNGHNEWVEGNLIYTPENDDDFEYIIIPQNDNGMFTKMPDLGLEKWYKVDPSTICQYTGLTDRTGVKIWENDIVRIAGYSAEDRGWIRFGSYSDARGMADTNYGWFINFIQNNGYYRQDFGYWAKKIIVIGNYWDTPELMKGGSDK